MSFSPTSVVPRTQSKCKQQQYLFFHHIYLSFLYFFLRFLFKQRCRLASLRTAIACYVSSQRRQSRYLLFVRFLLQINLTSLTLCEDRLRVFFFIARCNGGGKDNSSNRACNRLARPHCVGGSREL